MHLSFVEQQKGTFPFSTVGGGGGNVISLCYAKVELQINQNNITTDFIPFPASDWFTAFFDLQNMTMMSNIWYVWFLTQADFQDSIAVSVFVLYRLWAELNLKVFSLVTFYWVQRANCTALHNGRHSSNILGFIKKN